MHSVTDIDSVGSRFYQSAMEHLQDAHIPFLVGGAYALQAHTGIVRRTKDFDIFMLAKDVRRALKVLDKAGYETELFIPHWIAKSFCGEDFVDIIFSSGNGACPVDKDWFRYAIEGTVLGKAVKLSPAEEMIWQKSFILERDRCDVADVAHLIRHRGSQLDWDRLLARFAERWRVLFAQIVLFDFIFPTERDQIPNDVRTQLIEQMSADTKNVEQTPAPCHGTLLSATQYLRDVDLEGYRDGRLPPSGNLSHADVAIWTANFMKPK